MEKITRTEALRYAAQVLNEQNNTDYAKVLLKMALAIDKQTENRTKKAREKKTDTLQGKVVLVQRFFEENEGEFTGAEVATALQFGKGGEPAARQPLAYLVDEGYLIKYKVKRGEGKERREVTVYKKIDNND